MKYLALFAVLLFMSCEKLDIDAYVDYIRNVFMPSPPAPPQPQTVEVKIATASPFVPNPSGIITREQLYCWTKANLALDSLVVFYIQKLQNETDSSRKRELTEQYHYDRNTACEKNGISGGIHEYLWIGNNIGNRENSEIIARNKKSGQ